MPDGTRFAHQNLKKPNPPFVCTSLVRTDYDGGQLEPAAIIEFEVSYERNVVDYQIVCVEVDHHIPLDEQELRSLTTWFASDAGQEAASAVAPERDDAADRADWERGAWR